MPTIRSASIWGPWFGPPYRDFFLAIAYGRYWHPGRSIVRKALGYIGNTVHQIVKLLEAPHTQVCGRTFYLADDPPYTIREWANLIQETFGGKPIQEAPLWLLHWLAAVGDAAKLAGWNNPPLTRFRMRNMLTDSAFDLKELSSLTGKLPFSLADGVCCTVEWLRAYEQKPLALRVW